MNGQVSKPEHIFDRAREWEGLVQFATSSSADVRLGIVSGRRRQGKTYLLDAAANTFGGFFFTATDSTETDSLASLGVPWPATAAAAGTRSRTGTRHWSGCSGRWAKVLSSSTSSLT
jgi:hypothetical protein